MKSFIAVVLFSLSTSVLAGDGRAVVVCDETRFSDLTKIVIRETDLKGQYQLVETLRASAEPGASEKLSAVFGMAEIEKGEFPALTSWNGYSRTLIRYGRDHYAIETRDECTGSTLAISCKDAF